MVVAYCVPLGRVPNWEAEEGSENRVSASEGSRDTLRFQSGDPMPPSPSSSLPRLFLDIVSEMRLYELSRKGGLLLIHHEIHEDGFEGCVRSYDLFEGLKRITEEKLVKERITFFSFFL